MVEVLSVVDLKQMLNKFYVSYCALFCSAIIIDMRTTIACTIMLVLICSLGFLKEIWDKKIVLGSICILLVLDA